jgi:hypothetical protein
VVKACTEMLEAMLFHSGLAFQHIDHPICAEIPVFRTIVRITVVP